MPTQAQHRKPHPLTALISRYQTTTAYLIVCTLSISTLAVLPPAAQAYIQARP